MAPSDPTDGTAPLRPDGTAPLRPEGTVLVRPAGDATTTRIIEATARCLGRWGIAKTTVDDVAREAGVSRATVYRYFGGGKDQLILAVGIYEEGRFFAELAPILEEATTLSGTLSLAISEASRFLRDHEVLGTLVELEPQRIMPFLAFDRIGPLLYRTTAFLTPYLERFLSTDDIAAVAEWATRCVLSLWLEPSERLHPADLEGARHLVDRYLLPGLAARVLIQPTTSDLIDLSNP